MEWLLFPCGLLFYLYNFFGSSGSPTTQVLRFEGTIVAYANNNDATVNINFFFFIIQDLLTLLNYIVKTDSCQRLS